MKKILVLLLVANGLLSGCATKPYVSQAQLKARAIDDQFKSTVAYGEECEARNKDNPDVVLSYEQITVKGLNPPNRTELLASNKKINAKQKSAYQNYLKLDNECLLGAMDRLKGSPYATIFASTEVALAINDSNLLNEKITIGEANAKKLEIVSKFVSDLSTLNQQLKTQLSQAHSTELVIKSNNDAAEAAAWQSAINNMNTATMIRQNQTTQQLLQQNQYKPYGR